MMMKPSMFVCTLCVATLPVLANSTTVNTSFSDGANGWEGSGGFDGQGGGTTIVPRGGNFAHFMRTEFQNFFITFHNSTNADYLGDYTASDLITIAIDVRVENLAARDIDVSRPWTLGLRDYDRPNGDNAFSSVFFTFDNISQAQNSDWRTYSVSFNPNSIELPDGWSGFGAETLDPALPDGVTFRDVLSGVDEMVFITTDYRGGGIMLDHTIGIDNVSITRTVVPAPSALALIGLSGLVGTRRRR